MGVLRFLFSFGVWGEERVCVCLCIIGNLGCTMFCILCFYVFPSDCFFGGNFIIGMMMLMLFFIWLYYTKLCCEVEANFVMWMYL